MKCPYCGKRIQGRSVDCPHCHKMLPEKKKASKKRVVIGVLIAVAAVLLALCVTAVSVIYALLDHVERGSELSSGVISTVNGELDDSVTNIALFGLDTRKDNGGGRSDVIMVLSLDRKHNKIKLTSIARDTYVAVEGRKNFKLAHAWAYGKSNLAVKALNQNFDLNITDYAYVNFFEFAELIDYVGGVDITLTEGEVKCANETIAGEQNYLGITSEPIPGAGLQHLSGGQALAFARNRTIGTDAARTGRQRKVLTAVYEQLKKIPVSQYPATITRMLDMCHTNLTNGELLETATWAITKSPTLETFSLPTADCHPKSGKDAYINGTWYYLYDMDVATEQLHAFIYEEDASTKATEATSDR